MRRIGAKVGKVRLIPWLAWAFAAGWIIRYLRRLAGAPPRIWHGIYPLHMTRYMVQADRAANFPSRSVVRNSKQIKYDLVGDDDFDIVIQQPGVPWDEVHWRCLIDLLRHGDIWVAYFDCLFFPPDQKWANTWAFRLVRLVGVSIIVAPHGADVISRGRFVNRYDVVSRMQRDYPDWDLAEHSVASRVRIEMFCRYAAFVIGADSFLQRYLPRKDLVFKYFPMDCDALRPADGNESNSPPVVIHAPNHRLIKGTDYLFDAIERLQCAGVRCKLELLEEVPREEALRRYRESDIIADQFCNGAFGVFALEGLALGKPVLTYLDQEHLGDPVFNLPIVNTNPENLVAVLAVLLDLPTLRKRIGQAGRAAIERYQSVQALAEVWGRIYRHVWWGEPLNLETTQHFSPERKSRSFTEDPSRPDFWPVPVEDLLPEIHAALGRAGYRGGAISGELPVDVNGVEMSA